MIISSFLLITREEAPRLWVGMLPLVPRKMILIAGPPGV
jgi:hypothetical protein